MLVTRDAALAKRAQVMRLHGMSRDAFDRFTATVPSWYYEIVAPGFKYNLTDIAAALGLQQLKKADAFQQRARSDRRRCTTRRFAGLPLITAAAAAGRATSTPGTCTCCAWPTARRSARDRFIERLFAAGIGCSVHYIPLHLQPYWRDRYAPDAGAVPAQPARLRAHAEPADLHAHERCRRRARGRRGARARWRWRLSVDGQARCSTSLLAPALALLLLAPLLLAVALWIRLDSPGPVFFRQERVGRHGVPFRIHKFRTHAWPTRRSAARELTVGADPRITRAGALAAPHQARRAAAADRRAARRHEPGRAAARGAALRGAVPAGAARAGAERAPGHHRPGVARSSATRATLLARAADPEREYIERHPAAQAALRGRLCRARRRCASDLRVLGAHAAHACRRAGRARRPMPHRTHAPACWHRLDRCLARLRPQREPLSLLVDALVVAACWNITYLFRLGFERWISRRGRATTPG